MFLKSKKTKYVIFTLLAVSMLWVFQDAKADEVPPSSEIQWEDPWCPGSNNCGQGGCFKDRGINHCILYNCGTVTPEGQEDITAVTDYADYYRNYTKEMYRNWDCHQRSVPFESSEDPSLLRKTCEQTDPLRPETYGYNCWTGKCAIDESLATGSGISGAECMGSAVCGHQPKYTRRSLINNKEVVECTINNLKTYDPDDPGLFPYTAVNVSNVDPVNTYDDRCIEDTNGRSDTCFFSDTVQRRVDWPKDISVGVVRETPGEPRSSHIVYGDNINWNNADYYKDTLWINESGDPDSYQPNNHGWFDVNSDQDFWLLYADHEVQSNKVLAPKLYIDWAATPERIQAACESIGITPPPEDLPAGVETENDFRNWVGQQVGGYVAYKLLTVPYNCDIFGHLLWNSDSAIPPYNTNIDIHVEWPAYSELEDEGRLYGVESYKGDWRIKIAGWGSVARHDLLSPCGAYLVNSTCMMGDQQNTPGDHYFPGTSNRVKATCSLPVITPDQEGRGRRPGHCGRYDGWAADIDYDGVADSAYTIRGEGFSGKWLDYDAKNLNNCADI